MTDREPPTGTGDDALGRPPEPTSPFDLDATVASPSGSWSGPAGLPAGIGEYRVIRKLGEGGMGIVYEAEQSSPQRRVALKVVRGGPFVDELRLKMFQREAAVLGRLTHPNIGAIYEAGRTADGQHFFAMELVDGADLHAYLRARPRTAEDLRRRLGLFRLICDAVHHAHQKGVIHRDLKPSNIIVTEDASMPGAAPSVKILDFGLARITDADVRSTTLLSEAGMIKGTLAYMSPEQARGDQDAIDVRTDVYALGVILYEMVVGRRPYDVDRGSLVEALRVICEEPPQPINRKREATLDTDIETIAMKALEKDAERRYRSAAELGSDVERYLTSQPILARSPSAAYQLRKFARRNKTLVGGVAATLVVLTAGVIVSSTLGVREARARRAAERAGYVANVTAAEAGLRLFDLAEVKRRLAACPKDLRGWEWRHLAFRSEMSEQVLAGHTSRVYPVAVSPDGTRLASGSADPENTIRFWDVATGAPLAEFANGGPAKAGQTAAVRGLAFSPDGTRIASSSDDHSVRIWDVASRRKLLELTGHTARVNAVQFTPDGRELVSASWDGTVQRWDARGGQRLGIVARHDGQVWGVAVCGDGSRIVSGGTDNVVRLSERTTGHELWARRTSDVVLGVACSPAGDRVAAALLDGTVRMLDLATGDPVGSPYRHDDYPISVAFSPDGRTLASVGKDRTVHLWDARSGAALATLIGHDNAVTSVAFDATGKKLFSGSWDRTVRVWSTDAIRTSSVFATEVGTILGLGLSGDGGRIVSGSREGGIRVLDAASAAELLRIPVPGGPLAGVEVSPDGKWLAAVSEDQMTRVFDLASRGSVDLVREQRLEGLSAISFLGGGSEALIGYSNSGSLRRWNFRTGEMSGEIASSLQRVSSLEPSPDGKRVAAAGLLERRSVLELVDLASGRLLAQQEVRHIDPTAKLPNPVTDLAFSADGTRLVSAQGQDFTLHLWDGRTLEPLAAMPGHTEIVRSVAFSPDGTRIVSGADDYTVRLWEAATGDPLLALRSGGRGRVGFVRFTPDGNTIVSGEAVGFTRTESAIRMWRTVRSR